MRTFMKRDISFLKFCWRNYIQPILDYSSQLWGPSDDGGNLLKLEILLKSYTARAKGLVNTHYWDRLKMFGLSSIGRRIERYKIIFCHKIIYGQALNCGLTWSNSKDKGIVFNLINYDRYAKGNRLQTLQFIGPRLYNTLPATLRTYDATLSLDEWKFKLDEFLENIPDNPVCGANETGLCNIFNSKQTNSLLRWIPYLGLSGRRLDVIVPDFTFTL